MVRTPFAVVERTAAVDGEGRTIRNRRTNTLQLPLALLVFLAGAGWLQWRGRQPTVPAQDRPSGSPGILCTAVLGATLLTACGQDGRPGVVDRDRAERQVIDVTWDTLVHLVSEIEDSVFFSVGRPSADANGLWIPDVDGSRVVRFDWNGRLIRYVGRRGQGPGELVSVRMIDTDDSGTLWVLDLPNTRITGFDLDGRLVDEVPLGDLEWMPESFAVTGDGQSFLLMENLQELTPVILRRDGSTTRGSVIPVPDARGAWGMALQGLTTRDRGGDGWVYAFSSGDGFFRLAGAETTGGFVKYPEPVPFPSITRSVTQDGRVTSTTTRLANRTAAAASVWAQGGQLYVVFAGQTPETGRLLDRFDLETGGYLDTVLLPRRGYIAVWEDRVVVAGNNPVPEVLVLRRAG